MERSVETDHLRCPWPKPVDRLDQIDLVRQVIGGKSHRLAQGRHEFWRDPLRLAQARAAMHDPMADARQRVIRQLLADARQELLDLRFRATTDLWSRDRGRWALARE